MAVERPSSANKCTIDDIITDQSCVHYAILKKHRYFLRNLQRLFKVEIAAHVSSHFPLDDVDEDIGLESLSPSGVLDQGRACARGVCLETAQLLCIACARVFCQKDALKHLLKTRSRGHFIYMRLQNAVLLCLACNVPNCQSPIIDAEYLNEFQSIHRDMKQRYSIITSYLRGVRQINGVLHTRYFEDEEESLLRNPRNK